MSFESFKKRSKIYKDALQTGGFSNQQKEELAQAAYKAGERDGSMTTEDGAKREILLREWLATGKT